MHNSHSQQLPIIYVCGYASTQQDVESRVSDPFYGFNTGSAHIRVGDQGIPKKFFFESPLIRLMTDYEYLPILDYQQFVNGEFENRDAQYLNQRVKKLKDPLKSIWIYRFYDVTSESFGSNNPVRLEIEQIADGLKKLITDVKQATKANKVYLVAYSMGGLICRSLIQKVYPENNEKAEDHIDKFFTYGTPHGGINSQIAGAFFEQLTNFLEWNNIDDFNPQRMFKYFTPAKQLSNPAQQNSENFNPQSLDETFPVDRVFSLIGTNAKDYEPGLGISQKLVGLQSDGLVQIDKAYVKGSHRAYIYRTHGGRYGMVNSESGFENLQRFLFGNIKAKISLINVDRELLNREDTFYQMEVRFSIRGLPVAIHEQTIEHNSPITIKTEDLQKKHIPLFTAFFMSDRSATGDDTCRYLLHTCFHSFSKRQDWLFKEHIENMPIWSDRLLVDTKIIDGKQTATYSWRSVDLEPKHKFTKEIPLPRNGQKELGQQAAIHLDISQWD
ncbi:alpha/beta hydrolase [Mastigocoleus sp. MO_188.B34]|uniref:esterase/lipase family protein n=1 Tax=Mastigocoleus sp. MO_188.B34 TaxID=3036635 RepID=UPI0026103EDF|nr:alpha/beta hydrolase [Mastigocoleus sp. MO_188.B34]MDJ0695938.1 alpha/beta hydrolase [Mastigocoleus sp. MO_188.B34]